MRKTVLVDVDGVLGDFHVHTLRGLPALGIHGVTWDQITRAWDIIGSVGHEHREAIESHWGTRGWCKDIPVYEGAKDGVRALREVADVYFVTAQMTHAPYWMWERVQWLKEHFDADDRHVVFTLSKHLVLGDVLVDDKLSNVTSWTKAHPAKQGVLWSQPFNRLDVLPPTVVRCRNWDEVLRLI